MYIHRSNFAEIKEIRVTPDTDNSEIDIHLEPALYMALSYKEAEELYEKLGQALQEHDETIKQKKKV